MAKDLNHELLIERTSLLDRSFRILLVEDNPGDVILVNELLRSSGILYSLKHVSTLKATRSACTGQEFDVILLDLGLPDSVGLETLKNIHTFCERSAVVVMTGLDDENVALESLREGAQDYLVKGTLTTDSIMRGIKYGIERKRIEALLKLSESRYRKLSEELEMKVRERTHELETSNYQLNQELIERHLAEEALKESEVRLRELNATKDKFFNIIAHDLRNPFTSLLGSTELLNENFREMDGDKVAELIRILNDAAKRGYAILQNLLDWSRSQTGMMPFNPEKLNLKRIVDENIYYLKLSSEEKKITLTSEVQRDLNIIADRNMIHTVFRNLLGNGIKFTPTYGTVVVSATHQNNEATISIKDTGIGIPEDKINELFRIDTKYTRPGTNMEQGTGLGLKLCKEFVEMQGGKIWVKSSMNKGSEFIFTIPLSDS